ncbi:MAG: hypothetical protein IJX98_00930 [Clostridia bacterium]|nr:hypothetical protein [Clostridia bacterium]
MASVYVRRGIYENGSFRVVNKLALIEEEYFEEVCKELEPYLLSFEEISVSSYDDSDDERVTPTSRRTVRCKYREINPRKNSESLLMVDGKIIGVVFVVTKGNDQYTRAFSFDGSIAQSMRLGYSASHSSSFEYVDRVSLVKRGEKGVPETAREAKFLQAEMYPSL